MGNHARSGALSVELSVSVSKDLLNARGSVGREIREVSLPDLQSVQHDVRRGRDTPTRVPGPRYPG